MVDLRKIVNFWLKILGFHGAVLALILLLAVLNEMITQSAPLVSLEFWLAVAVDMLPAIFVVMIVLWLVSRFLQRVHGLDNNKEGLQFLIRNRFGKRGLAPFVKIDQGQTPSASKSVLTQVGGKGSLIVGNDSAVVLQQDGRLTDVTGPGFVKLEPFEKIYDALDLRPKRQVWPVKAMTQEGIPITWKLEIQYRLEYGRRRPNEKYPHPFLEDSVLRAATCKQISRDNGQVAVLDWEKLVFFKAKTALRSILIQHRLNQLVDPRGTQIQAARETIQHELTNVLPKQVARYGARITGIQLHNFQVDDEATQQWIKTWQARWQQINSIGLTLSNGGQVPVDEMLRAETLRLPLKTLYQELEKQDADQAIILLLLTHFLSKVTDRTDPKISTRLSSTLDQLQGTLKPEQAGAGTGEQTNGHSSSRPTDSATAATRPQRPNEVAGEKDDLSSPRKKSVINFAKEPPKKDPTRPRPVLRVIPIVSEIAAGLEKPAFDDVLGYVQQTDKLEFKLLEEANQQVLNARRLRGKQLKFLQDYTYFVVQVTGDSMDLAGIAPDDYVILRKPNQVSLYPANGDIVAVALRDDADRKATLKRIYIEKGTNNRPERIRLEPESSNHEHVSRSLPPTVFAGDDPLVTVVGIAEAVLKPADPLDNLPQTD